MILRLKDYGLSPVLLNLVRPDSALKVHLRTRT